MRWREVVARSCFSRTLDRRMPAHANMVPIPAGQHRQGSDAHYIEERPARSVSLPAFKIDRTPVTNAAFAAFVAETGWVTLAERLRPTGSAVFVRTAGPVDLGDPTGWWRFVEGANWKVPLGPGSESACRTDHPVVHIAQSDAAAFAAWRGARLPSEAEWEAAGWGGETTAEYSWGPSLLPNGALMANIWTGAFPWWFAGEGEPGPSAVGRFPANGYGLFDMIGNVWEWTQSPFQGARSSCCVSTSGGDDLWVLKGGSHLCAAEYCARYRPAARIGVTAETSTGHIGFRCAADL